MSLPRLLVLMGSGETSPTMVKTHRSVLERLGPAPVPAVLLDTPYGFQSNADELSARAIGYFGDSIGQRLDVARYRSAAEVGSAEHESALALVRDARFVFAGPGSPSYALRTWRESLIPKLLAEKLTAGGCITFASAAALTVGAVTVPVYEIYKVGEEPRWLEGLDLLGEATGLRAAVIPHFNNAEGGTHDTRYCYLGEDRLRVLESSLPDDGFVLGIDEHTAVVVDLDAGTGAVTGLGVLTVRRDGAVVREVPAGETVALEDLVSGAATTTVVPSVSEAPAQPAPAAAYPLVEKAAAHEATFTAALATGDVSAAVQAILDLEAELEAWAADTPQADERDRARSVLRSMVVRLGDVARTGARDPRDVVGPYVEALLDERTASRADRRWADADRVRDRLVDLGVEVRDSAAGTDWDLRR